MFIVHLKNGETLQLLKQCTNIIYEDDKICSFVNRKGNRDKTLAVIPYENILWIENKHFEE